MAPRHDPARRDRPVGAGDRQRTPEHPDDRLRARPARFDDGVEARTLEEVRRRRMSRRPSRGR